MLLKQKKGIHHLLRLRWHNVDDAIINDTDSMTLYNKIQHILTVNNGHGGYEYKRSGGSEGKTEYNHDLLKWMHSSKNFPRKGKGV